MSQEAQRVHEEIKKKKRALATRLEAMEKEVEHLKRILGKDIPAEDVDERSYSNSSGDQTEGATEGSAMVGVTAEPVEPMPTPETPLTLLSSTTNSKQPNSWPSSNKQKPDSTTVNPGFGVQSI